MSRSTSLAGLLVAFAACADATPRTTFEKSDAAVQPGLDVLPAPSPCIRHPENYDFPDNECDDDGDGVVDNPPSCDGGLGETGSAEELVRALGLCALAADHGHGLVSASFTSGVGIHDDPNPRQHGVLPGFGDVVRPREGKRLGVLSTGYAQEYDGAPGRPFARGQDWQDTRGRLPPGFPAAARGCEPLGTEVHDAIGLRIEAKVPRNASGLRFDFDFYTAEWPRFVCSQFNDGFIAYLQAPSFQGGVPGNVSFDAQLNPISVNNAFFDRCTSQVMTGCEGQRPARARCDGGTAELGGTGFGILGPGCDTGHVTKGGATGWLTSRVPLAAGDTMTLDFVLWDTGDGILDSTVLLDNFGWLEGTSATPITERPH